MNRELKFRVWNSWVKQFITNDLEEVGMDIHDFVQYGKVWEVLPKDFIVQQYTGLKDKNNRGIYEGDILVAYPREYFSEKVEEDVYKVTIIANSSPKDIILRKGLVIYLNDLCRFSVNCPNEKVTTDLELYGYCWEIIGNIYENPELL